MNTVCRDLGVIRISKKQWLMLIGFVISLFSETALMLWMIAVPILLITFYGVNGAVEFFIFLQFRSLLSYGVGVTVSGTSAIVKWGAVFCVSFYILIKKKKIKDNSINCVILLVCFFSGFAIIAANTTSSYPLVASFKVLSYCVPFVAIICGVSETRDRNWIGEIVVFLGILLVVGLVFIGSEIGYLRNGYSFQGVFNHPNVYGNMVSLFLAGYLYICKRVNMKSIIGTLLCILLIYPSKSRTAMISVLCVFAMFMVMQDLSLKNKLLMILLTVFLLGVIIYLNEELVDMISTYVFKGNNPDVFSSRQIQITRNLDRFIAHPLCGTGFNVPYVEGEINYSFSFDLMTENGNLFLALLGDVGIIGFVLFFVAYGKMFLVGKRNLSIIFWVTILVSMGEMTFFSTNNFGIIMYLYIAIFAIDKREGVIVRNNDDEEEY